MPAIRAENCETPTFKPNIPFLDYAKTGQWPRAPLITPVRGILKPPRQSQQQQQQQQQTRVCWYCTSDTSHPSNAILHGSVQLDADHLHAIFPNLPEVLSTADWQLQAWLIKCHQLAAFFSLCPHLLYEVVMLKLRAVRNTFYRKARTQLMLQHANRFSWDTMVQTLHTQFDQLESPSHSAARDRGQRPDCRGPEETALGWAHRILERGLRRGKPELALWPLIVSEIGDCHLTHMHRCETYEQRLLLLEQIEWTEYLGGVAERPAPPSPPFVRSPPPPPLILQPPAQFR